MLPFGVTIPATVLQRSEIPEGLTNYPVYNSILWCLGIIVAAKETKQFFPFVLLVTYKRVSTI